MPNQPPREKPFSVKVRQTEIKIYPLARGEFQFRYYVGGETKRVTRSTRTAIVKEATRLATELDNGRLQAGAMTPAEVQSYTHARRLLTPEDPPLHVIVEEWQRFKAAVPGASLDELAAIWKRNRPRGKDAEPGASLVETLQQQMIASLEESAQASGSRRNVTGFRHDLTRFAAKFGRKRIAEVSTEEIQTWLRGLGVGPRRQDNIRAELVTFFHFARGRGHLQEELRTEPEKVPKLYKASGEISYYRPSELRRYFQQVDERWLPWLAIAAFAGLRSSEIGRLEWKDFDWTERRIYVPASKALKVRRRRRVPMEDNLFAWLLPWHEATGRLYDLADPNGAWTKATARLAEMAKIPWRNNNLRHSYGTFQMARHENFGQVAAWMGNSESKVKSNYDGVASPTEAKEWFAISPDRAAGSTIVPMTLGKSSDRI